MSEGHTRNTLLKILALLGSDHDGEVLAAARRAHRFITDSGATWADWIVDRPPGHSTVEWVHCGDGDLLFPPVGQTWTETVLFLAARRAGRTEIEASRLDRMAQEQWHTISEPDARWLVEIHEAMSVLHERDRP